MLPYKYFILTAIFFITGNTFVGFIKNLSIKSDVIGKELLTNVRLSYISTITFFAFGCIANSKLEDALFVESGKFTLHVGSAILTSVLCGISLLMTIFFSIDTLFKKLSEDEENIENEE